MLYVMLHFLQYPDFSLPFHVATDASNTGIGGVLYQPKTEGEHITPNNIVAIYSKILTESQRDILLTRKNY